MISKTVPSAVQTGSSNGVNVTLHQDFHTTIWQNLTYIYTNMHTHTHTDRRAYEQQ